MRRAALALGLLLGFSITAKAEKFTAADVLTWEAKNQDSYFQISIAMIAAIASQNDGAKARCINNWYFSDAAKKVRANRIIRKTMKRFSRYRPEGVILAVIEKQCGKMIFKG